MEQDFDKQRRRLEQALVFTAEDLLSHMGTAAFKLEIVEGLYLVAGREEDIKKLLD